MTGWVQIKFFDYFPRHLVSCLILLQDTAQWRPHQAGRVVLDLWHLGQQFGHPYGAGYAATVRQERPRVRVQGLQFAHHHVLVPGVMAEHGTVSCDVYNGSGITRLQPLLHAGHAGCDQVSGPFGDALGRVPKQGAVHVRWMINVQHVGEYFAGALVRSLSIGFHTGQVFDAQHVLGVHGRSVESPEQYRNVHHVRDKLPDQFAHVHTWKCAKRQSVWTNSF